ncbi:MAG: tetratricopeptide repeat protein [Gammaproteobacteria bacterium]|nr:tetratricopeptide repeat protein [Gammaproteobacteria bacterium]
MRRSFNSVTHRTTSPHFFILLSALFFAFATSFYVVDLAAQETTQLPSGDVRELLMRGRALSKKGNLAEAAKYFEAVLVRDSLNAEAHYHLGVAYMRSNNYEKGVDHVRTSIALSPYNLTLRGLLASVFNARKEYLGAIDEYLKLIGVAVELRSRSASTAVDSRHLGAHQKLVKLYTLIGDLPSALEHLKTAISLGKGDANYDAVLALGEDLAQQYAEQGEVENALNVINVVRDASDDEDPMTHLKAGVSYQEIGRPELAEAAYKRALELDPENTLARANLGTLYLGGKRLDLAAREFETILKLGKDKMVAKRVRATLVESYIKASLQLLAQRQYRQALNILLKAKAHDPDNIKVLENIGAIYLAQTDLVTAQEVYEKIRELKPDYAKAYYVLGSIYSERSMFDEAATAYNKVLDLNRRGQYDSDEIKQKIAIIGAKSWIKENHFDKAANAFSDIIANDPKNAEAYYFLGIIYSSFGHYDSAIAQYEKVIELKPEFMSARLKVSALYNEMWQEDRAIRELNAITQSSLKGKILSDAKRQMAAIRKKTDGVSYNVTQTVTYDDNINLSSGAPLPDQRFDLFGGLTYRYHTDPSTRFSLMLRRGLISYVDSGFDRLVTLINPSLTVGRRSRNFTFAYSNSEQFGFQEEESISVTNQLSSTLRLRFQPALPEDRPEVLYSQPASVWVASLGLSYSDFDSKTSRQALVPNPRRPGAFTLTPVEGLLSSEKYAATLSLTHSSHGSATYSGSYGLTINDNTIPEGSDYAYIQHALTGTVAHSLAAGFRGSFSYTFTLTDYKNADSFSGSTEKRQNTSHAINARLDYPFSKNIRFFGTLSWLTNNSSLPVASSLLEVLPDSDNNSDAGSGLLTTQSSSLGNYQRTSIGFGVTLVY